ncbi:methyltransferase domain-containing protein [Alphaproteobacteria bacterium KMM 3653]|uniref:Methyltransferase domain-containing protein n=1 Tax=Harenicola maris TaxID=2841044 RepID=A0AAP2CP13_9RHOB|nr:methyltransferase domain-containing protein [Harenicola maris]
MAQPAYDARALALRLIDCVLRHQRMLSEALGDEDVESLPPEIKARGQRLAVEVLRHLSRADAAMKPYIQQPVSPPVKAILRLGVVELLALDGAPHGVVNAAVGLTRRHQGTARAKGLVNAILRRVSEDGREAWDKAPAQRMPKWLRGRVGGAFGNAAASAIELAHERGAPLDLSVKGDAAALAEAVGGEVLPTGSVRLAAGTRVSGLPGYDAGDWWVQDAGATLAAKMIGGTGLRVLDLCAAPGGKTMQLAAAGHEVTALDLSGRRLERLRANLERTGLTAQVVTEDALHWEPEAPFDAVLLDAPCSATGTLRRHPDLPHVREADAIKELTQLQAQMLDRAAGFVKPGGQVIYCVCSLLPAEGEAQLAAALERLPELERDAGAEDLPGVPAEWHAPDGGLRLRPDFWAERGGIDGFFVAALRRRGDAG